MIEYIAVIVIDLIATLAIVSLLIADKLDHLKPLYKAAIGLVLGGLLWEIYSNAMLLTGGVTDVLPLWILKDSGLAVFATTYAWDRYTGEPRTGAPHRGEPRRGEPSVRPPQPKDLAAIVIIILIITNFII